MFNQLGRAFTPTKNGQIEQVSRSKHYTTHRVIITPEYAKQLLETSAGNRTINRNNVKHWAEKMKSGKWVNNAQAIHMSEATADRPLGILINGHTRLTACIMAGVPFESDIVWNLPYEVIEEMDSNDVRRPHHHLQFMGIPNAVNVSATFNKYHAYKNKYYHPSEKPHSSVLRHEAATWWRENPYADVSLMQKTVGLMNGSCAQVAYVLIREAGCRKELVDLFFEQLVKGIGLDEGNPALSLRNALTRHDIKNMSNSTVGIHRYIAMIIRMFNYWVAGDKCSKVYPPQTGNFVQPIIPPHARANNTEGGK